MTRRPPGPHQGGTNVHCKEMDRLLANRPPVIVWEKNKRGVMVAIEIRDPHAERSTDAQVDRLNAPADRADLKAAAKTTEQARLRLVEMLQEEADQVADRFKTHRANNTRLMAAARTEI
jgi:hypothetical protein